MSYTSQEQAGFIKAANQANHDRLNVAKIVEVVSINGDSLVTVAPVIREGRMLSGRDREYHDIGTIADIPVITGGCGSVQVKPNIEVGCIGSIVHYDSDITNYVVDGAIYEDAYTDNRHDLNDCFFLPGLTGVGNTFNTDGCYEIISSGVTFRLCDSGFDIIVNGRSLIESLISSGSLPSDWGQT